MPGTLNGTVTDETLDVGATTAVPSTAEPGATPAGSSDPVEKSEAEQYAEYLEVATKAANPEPTDTDSAPSAAKPTPDKAASDPANGDKDPSQKAEADEDEPDDEAEDEGEDKGEPFGKHPRWQKMVAARNQYREQAQRATSELDTLRTPADEYGKIEQYMKSNGLEASEVVDGFRIMALMKHDPAAARAALLEQLGRLDTFLGNALPPDLQRQVDEGYTTQELAQELAHRRQLDQRHAQETAGYRQSIQQQQHEHSDGQARQAMAGAVSQWEAGVKQRDPDYAMKQPFVLDRLKVLRQQYQVQTPEHAVQLAQMAYDQATKQLRSLIKKPEVKPNGAGSRAGSAAATKHAPQSFEEACLQAAGFAE